MKTLTVRQPHASLIALGVKTIETRSWSTRYRGPLLIHAGKQFVEKGYSGEFGGWLARRTSYSGAPYLLAPGTWPGSGALDWNEMLPAPLELPLGAIVASCKLVDCVPIVRDIDHAYENEPDPKKALTYALPFVVPEFDLLGERPADAGKTLIRVTYRPAGDDRRHTNFWDQLPYGDFTPGRFAWLLEDIQSTTERCPACWGEGIDPAFEGMVPTYCRACKGVKVCAPTPAKGKQGLWKWEP